MWHAILLVSACSALQLHHKPASLVSLVVSFPRMILAFLAAQTVQPAATTALTFALPVLLVTIYRMALASIALFAMETALLVLIPIMWLAVLSVFLVQF